MRGPLLIAGICLFVTGCTGPQAALVTGNYDTMFRLMGGELSVSRSPDGKEKFTFVMLANAYDGFVDGDHEPLRKEALAGQMGKHQFCPKGYTIDKRTEREGAIVYEGRCKT